jgi:hypothetical protein
MYDLERRIIFTHPPKCAGTTIEDLFNWYPDVKNPNSVANFRRYKHNSLKNHIDFLNDMGEDVSTFFKFSCIRNPWDVAVSFFYHDKIEEIKRFKDENPFKELPEFLKMAETATFEEYINYRYEQYKRDYNFLETNKFLLYNGEYILDYMVRYETFNDDLKKLKDRYSLEDRTPHRNKGVVRPSYKNLYTLTDTIDKVAEMANTTIKMFGYSF